MNSEDLIKKLQSIDLFQDFKEKDLIEFTKSTDEIFLPQYEQLFEEGAEAKEIFILLEGELNICKGNRPIATIMPVDYVGEMALIEDKPRSATVLANMDSTLLKITPEQFQNYFSKQHSALFSILKTLSQRVRKDSQVIVEEFTKANILIHDMRNLISTFFLLELLEDIVTDENALKSLKMMETAREGLIDMMDEAMANIKKIPHVIPVETNSFSELVNELMETELRLHPDLVDKDIDFSIAEDLPPFPFSKLDIRRVLINLILNAAQASKKGSKINIFASKKNGSAEIQVIDSGSGIPGDLAARIFEPNYTTKEDGNGLGLSSCRQIIETRHGGTLTFKSSRSTGTTFIFTLPLEQSK